MKIKFCGAAREVTGSAHLLTLDDGFTILLDCGLYQGYEDSMENFNREWLFEPEDVDCLILSHAHIDHTGRVPKLVKDGFKGDIHATHATRSLCGIMLMDSAMIQERDAEYFNKKKAEKAKFEDVAFREPLYTLDDVHQAMDRFITYSYDHWFRINDRVEAIFRDAGHILGSASVTLRIREGNRTIHVGFTGDIGRPNRPILRDPQPMPEVDVLISESTYGDREHESAPAETGHFLQIIQDTCVKRGGKVIIPAFSVGRTQELVYMLDKLANAGQLPDIPVYVDSPLAVNATMVFASHPECFDAELTEYMLVDDNPFGFNRLHYIRKVEQSKALNTSKEACIIISAAGMINAGRIKHHVYNNIDHEQNTILIVGYCSPDTPGGKLRAGADHLRLFGDWKPVRAKVEVMDSFSAHGDRLELFDFLRPQREHAKRIFLVHGDYDAQQAFQEMLTKAGFAQVDIPALGQEVEV
ncbi:MAG: MBL fold metallo-hydrolase [Lewinellaceae bacterium]|nr:MBL fold metallo-hydrolase [Lewinellaceae bacterium]